MIVVAFIYDATQAGIEFSMFGFGFTVNWIICVGVANFLHLV